ncbi:hypothetical protein RHSIM_Rhsim11G0112400 [Rhododendron simsii]|uniref:Uncharacterized protein n=1 Tax=Rhododendron simsii TaxID=118357 RepID=A0A834G7M3_RHOSS|nr:hypothetical protein RHSIM_Rhsim11G0112400 [Rhododendron simsii]
MAKSDVSISFYSLFRHSGNCNSAIIGKATEWTSSAEWYALVSANLGLLLGLIQIYQNRKDSLFESRPATMAISLAALCISVFAPVALLRSKAVKVEEEEEQTTGQFLYCRRIRGMNVLIPGVVTLSCLVSVFVADGLVWIVFVSCACIVSALLVACSTIPDPYTYMNQDKMLLRAVLWSNTSESSRIPFLSGENFSEWKDKVLLALGCMDLDLAIREDEPPKPTNESSIAVRVAYDRWERSNRLSLMLIKTHISSSIRNSIPSCDKVKDYMKAIEE